MVHQFAVTAEEEEIDVAGSEKLRRVVLNFGEYGAHDVVITHLGQDPDGSLRILGHLALNEGFPVPVHTFIGILCRVGESDVWSGKILCGRTTNARILQDSAPN